METTAKYRLMGAFTLVAILGVFAFVYWLNHGGGLGERSTYEIKFLGAVPGLRQGAAVQFNGIRVGEVTDLRLDGAKPQEVVARISVDRGTPIRRDTRVSLDFQGLMGVTSVALKGGAADSPLLADTPGTPPLLVADASAGADLTTTAREALHRLDGILADNSDALRGALSNLNTFTAALAKNSDRIDSIVAGLERMTGGDSGKAPLQSFDLTAPRVFPPYEPAVTWQLAVAEPTSLIIFDSQRLVERTASGARVPMQGSAQWADTLPKLVQAKLIQTLENATTLASIARAADGASVDRQLVVDIRNFEFIDADRPSATVELAAKIIGDDNRVLRARVFRADAPAPTKDADAAAAALDRAFGDVAREMANWVRETLQ
jgi:phospholipid/cholesterol/gamma-HCH transport system substrate-binding protein